MNKAAMTLFVGGLLLTAGGAGGVEASISDWDLAGAVLISAVGLGLMYIATLFLDEEFNNDQRTT